MKTRNQSFFARLRQRFLMWWIEREIYGGIFPHLNRRADMGYPFHSDNDLTKESIGESVKARFYINLVDRQADAMGKAYGEAFQYIMYRDLNRRLRQYLGLVQERVPNERRVAEFAR